MYFILKGIMSDASKKNNLRKDKQKGLCSIPTQAFSIVSG
jgi:hypothetical protein